MDEEEINRIIALGFEPYDPEKYKDIPDQYTDTPNLEPPPPPMNDDQYRAHVEHHKNDSPFSLVKDGFYRAGFDDVPEIKYQREPGTDDWICRLTDDKDSIYVGISRDKKIALNLAAAQLLDSAIDWDWNDFFYLPRNRDEAKHYVAVKREALQKMTEESENPINLVNEYAQFYEFKIKYMENDDGPPFTSTIELAGEIHVGEPEKTKKEARRNTASSIYDKLMESGEYFKYKQEQEVAKVEKKLEKEKRRAEKKAHKKTTDEIASVKPDKKDAK